VTRVWASGSFVDEIATRLFVAVGPNSPSVTASDSAGVPLARNARKRQARQRAAIAEIAAAEKISEAYGARVLRLTLLAPDIVETILGGRHPTQMTLAELFRRFPILWSAQRAELLRPPV
jgi:hypothetical protein